MARRARFARQASKAQAEVTLFGQFTYGHDANGNLASIQYPTGHVVAYAYDALNRMTSAALDGSTVATLGWDVLSRRTSVTYGDSSSASYGYDNADRLTSLNHVFPNGTSANVNFSFGYDAASRLTSESDTNAAYEYAPPAAVTTYATANNLNEYPSVGAVNRTYWQTGASAQDGVLSRYYDQQGLTSDLYSIVSGGAEGLYSPGDANGRIIWRNHNTPYAETGYANGVTAPYTSATDLSDPR